MPMNSFVTPSTHQRMKDLLPTGLLGTLILVLAACQPQPAGDDQMMDFGQRYTDAWNSGIPEQMASFYAEDGTLIINGGTPSVGRAPLAATANAFMEAFPDLMLSMDSLVADGETYRYHWTFAGTNSGTGGTGKTVVFSGFEQWTMNDAGLIQRSIGTFDAADYNRQLKGE